MSDRKFENLGRKELANPVAEALRRLETESLEIKLIEKCCYSCKHFKDTNNYRHRLPWCMRNETDTTDDDVCDDWELY